MKTVDIQRRHAFRSASVGGAPSRKNEPSGLCTERKACQERLEALESA